MKNLNVLENMKKYFVVLLMGLVFFSCNSSNSKPDVSSISIQLETLRFDQDLFMLDTNQFSVGMQHLQLKYPEFLPDFLNNVLGVSPNEPQFETIVKKYIHDFKPIYSLSNQKFKDFSKYSNQVKELLQYTKYYFLKYRLPQKLITFIGPMDAFYENALGWSGDIYSNAGLGVGLQLHLGSNASIYEQAENMGYPVYISRRFNPETIVVNCAINIIDDFMPEIAQSENLITQMVDKGKRMYILDKLLPDIADSLKIGYTSNQLKGCQKNEAMVWNVFIQDNLLFETDYPRIKGFLTDGPNTPELGDQSPGNIALFAGWQLVKSYMEHHPKTTMPQLLAINGQRLYEESKYKP
jgi:hypothetical protein